jgi:hypothetical protein
LNEILEKVHRIHQLPQTIPHLTDTDTSAQP